MSPGHSSAKALYVCTSAVQIPVSKQGSRSPSDVVYVGIGFWWQIGDWSYGYDAKERKKKRKEKGQKYSAVQVRNET
jgi:hypothetical protein